MKMYIFHYRNINVFNYEVLAQTPLEICAIYAMDKIAKKKSLNFKYMWCKDFRKGIVGLHF